MIRGSFGKYAPEDTDESTVSGMVARWQSEADSPLDPGIAYAVEVLRAADVETFESCEGGPGHAYAEPTVRFHGDRSEGYRALAVVVRAGLPVSELRRTWPISDGEPTGPWWEVTFLPAPPTDGPCLRVTT